MLAAVAVAVRQFTTAAVPAARGDGIAAVALAAGGPTRGAAVATRRGDRGLRVHFDLDIGGRVRRLRVERRDGQYHVAVDDRVFQVDPRRVSRETLSLLVQEGDGPVRERRCHSRGAAGQQHARRDASPDTRSPATLVSRFGADGRRGRRRRGAGRSR